MSTASLTHAPLISVHSPIDGSFVANVPAAGRPAIDHAVELANTAFHEWSQTPVKERVQPLFRFKALVEAHMEGLAALVSRENGKTIAEAHAEIQRGLEVVEFAAALPHIAQGDLLEVSHGVDCHTRRLPLGATMGVTPFNFPAMVPMWMFPVAIACGNTFILKPSDQTPLTPMRIAELFAEAKLPEGVFQVVQGGREAVEALLDHPNIRAAAFVGSTPVAKAVFQRGTAAGKRVLALGGAKNHLVVMPDADPAVAARNIAASVTGCAGQRCMAASVLLAVGDCERVIELICEEMAKTRPGHEMGAVISAAAKHRIVSYIDDAERAGATIRLDGRKAAVPGRENGHYVGPTAIDRIPPGAKCLVDEIFGPVLSIVRVPTLDDALQIENASPFGNAASIFTTNGAAARRFETRCNAGMVGVNIGVPVPRDPFAFGGWNDSRFGYGDITGADGVSFWTKTRKVTVKWGSAAARNWMS